VFTNIGTHGQINARTTRKHGASITVLTVAEA